MNYTIDEQGIHYKIEDDEADRVARIVEQRRLIAVEPVTPPIPLVEAVATRRASASAPSNTRRWMTANVSE